MNDHDRIYLEPGDGDPTYGRLWCQDDVWMGNPDYDEPATEYIRADIYEREVELLTTALRDLVRANEYDPRDMEDAHSHYGYMMACVDNARELLARNTNDS